MALGSTDNYFRSSKNVLKRGRSLMINRLKELNYSRKQIDVFLKAYDFFRKYPKDYDGATGTQDLYDVIFTYEGVVYKLELWSMLHDYFYVIGAYYNKKLLRLCDRLLIKQMRTAEKSGFEIFKRQKLLFLLREVVNYAWWKKQFDAIDKLPQTRQKTINTYLNAFN